MVGQSRIGERGADPVRPSTCKHRSDRHEKLDAWTVGHVIPGVPDDIDVGSLGLPVRAHNVLVSASIVTTKELAKATVHDLSAMRNAGVGTVTAIILKLADLAIRGGEALPDPVAPTAPSLVSRELDPDTDVLDAIVLPTADDLRLLLVAEYLLAFRDRWFELRGIADEHGVASQLQAISSTSWATLTTCQDPRLAHAPAQLHRLHQDHEAAHPLNQEADLLLEFLATPGLTSRQLKAITSWALEVLAWGETMPSSPLEIQAWLLVEAALRGRRRVKVEQIRIDALIQRFGLDGRAPITLQEGGDLCGFSRERMRQVQTKMLEALKPARVSQILWVPALSAFNGLQTDELMAFSDLIEAAQGLGFVAGEPTLPGLQEASKFVGIRSLDGAGGLIGIGEDAYRDVLRLVMREVKRRGLAEPTDVAERIRALDDSYTAELVAWIVEAVPDLQWVPVVGDNAWIGSISIAAADIRLRNTARSMLSVTSSLKVESILEGLRRRETMRQDDRSLPLAAARAFFDLWPEFEYDKPNDSVSPVEPLDFEMVLAESAITMVKVLRGFPDQVGSRGDVMEAFVKAGMKSATANVWLSFHEILSSYGWAVWGLVGATPSPTRVDAIQQSVRAQFEDADMSTGWGPDGNPHLTFTATKSFINTGTLSFNWPDFLRSGGTFDLYLAGPAALSQTALEEESGGEGDVNENDDEITPPTTPTYGTARFSTDHGFSWGWSAVIQAAGVKRSDHVKASFNVTEGTAIFEII